MARGQHPEAEEHVLADEIKKMQGRQETEEEEKQRQCKSTMREVRKGNETRMGRALKVQVRRESAWVRRHQRQGQAKPDQALKIKNK